MDINSIGRDAPQNPPNDPREEKGDWGKRLSDHDKDLKQLRNIQAGILVVVAIGFIAVVVALLIFFIQIVGDSNKKIETLSSENNSLKTSALQIQIDSLNARLSRNITPPPIQTFSNRHRSHKKKRNRR